MKKIKYHRQKCIGCGICANEALNIWRINKEDGKADLHDSELKKGFYMRTLWPDEVSDMQKIVKLCPSRAIKLV